jgi:hypothetical protein
LSDPDLQNHIDKVFEQYKNRFRDFEILLTVVIGSGIVILAVPLGQYYFMYVELQDNVQRLVDILDEISRSSLSPARNMTEIIAGLNASSVLVNNTIQNKTTEIAAPVKAINSNLSNLANNISAILNVQQVPSIDLLIETVNSTKNTTDQLSANLSEVRKPTIISQNTNQSLTSVISNVSAIANDTKQLLIVPNLMDALRKFNTSRSEINNFVESWKSLETPFGELPIGLTNLLAILPVGLVAGYVICILSLDHAMHARERLHHLYKKYYNLEIINYDKEITTLAPIWLDPISKGKLSKLKKIAQLLVLVVPIIMIFSLSVYLILNIWYTLEPHLILAGETYTDNLGLLKSLLTRNSVEFNESDLVIGDLPLFFNTSGSFYKDIYLNLYVIVIPFFLVIVIVLRSYFRYSIPQRRPHA